MARNFTIDPARLAAFRAQADEARGAARLSQQRVTEAHNRLSEAQAELTRTERSRPGSPTGVVRIDSDGRRRGSFESHHQGYVDGARSRVDAARAELDQLATEQAAGAARRSHDVEMFARLERHVAERRVAR